MTNAAVKKSKYLFSSPFRAAPHYVANCMVHAFGSVYRTQSRNSRQQPEVLLFALNSELYQRCEFKSYKSPSH